MIRAIAGSAFLLVLALSAPMLAESHCTNFPWIVTGSDVPGGVLVHVCGLWVGCFPHNPVVEVSGDQIGVAFTAAELPDCVCTVPEIPFDQSVFVPALPAGTYTVMVTVIDCGQPHVVGTGSIVSGGVPAVPGLDRGGMVILISLLGAVALWKLRVS